MRPAESATIERKGVPVRYVLLLALAVRVAFALFSFLATGNSTAFHALDTGSYIDAAQSLAAGRGFTTNGAPEIIRTPGYPLLLLPGAPLGSLEPVAVALQTALSVLTVYLVYRIALHLFDSRRAASLCALLYALEPLSVLYASRILTETLFTFLIALFLYCIAKFFRGGSLPYLAASALALAASVYVRPIIISFSLVVALILLGWAVLSKKSVRLAAAALLFFVLSVAPVGLWQLRNAAAADYNGFSAISDISWYFYQGASVTAAERGVPYYVVQEELGYSDRERYFQAHPEQRTWPEGRVYEYMGREGRKVTFGNIPIYARIHAIGMVKTLVNPGGVEYLKSLNLYPDVGGDFGVAVNAGIGETIAYLVRENPLLLAVNLLFGLMLAAYLLLSLLTLLSRHTWSVALVIVLALALYLLVLSGGPQSLSRFRHPIMPEICILAGYGLSVIMDRVRARRAARMRGAVATPA
jgi:4-amino-4-deoxy-L-arabinose transferase-like glycosyltransferase